MNILITGASKGIGYQLALAYCKIEAHHVLAVSRNAILLKQLKEKKEGMGLPGRLTVFPFDLNEVGDREKEFLAIVGKEFSQLHVLVNNAGKLVNQPFEKFSMTEAKEIFEVNFFSPSQLIRVLLPMMGKKEAAHIVNISSMGGFQGSSKFPGLSYYSASKAALAVLTECLAEELKEKNVFLNCLAIGAVQTEMLQEAFPGYKAPVTPEEMAAWIADFSLSGHRLFNGKVLPVSVSTP
jgi:3-oxoacyl-[acyl-carrier protein] reductase